MEERVTQGSVQSALTCINESYCVGDVIVASSAVIGSGVILRADPGCSITIRDGVCLGPGVIVHASQGAIELHQGVCLAGGVLVVGQGSIGKQVCVGAGTTLINPSLPDCAMIGANCLWGDDSRSIEPMENQVDQQMEHNDGGDAQASADSTSPQTTPPQTTPPQTTSPQTTFPQTTSPQIEVNSVESGTVTSKTVIGKQQFEMMLQKMFPNRDAFQRSQDNSQ